MNIAVGLSFWQDGVSQLARGSDMNTGSALQDNNLWWYSRSTTGVNPLAWTKSAPKGCGALEAQSLHTVTSHSEAQSYPDSKQWGHNHQERCDGDMLRPGAQHTRMQAGSDVTFWELV